MSYKNFILLLIIITNSFIIFSCKNDIVSPPDNPPGRRDYTWKIDTLNLPMNLLSDVWGSSSNDVWVVGDEGTGVDRLQHYKDFSWNVYKNETISCSGRTLFGFSERNIWMGGGVEVLPGASIWHYDGNFWRQNFRYDVGAYITLIYDIWGNSPDNIYACGVHQFQNNDIRGFILHYDGKRWKELLIAGFNSQFYKIRGEKDRTFVYASVINNGYADSTIFYELNGNKLKKIFSAYNLQGDDIEVIDANVCFLIERSVYRYYNSKFYKLFSVNIPQFGYRIYGRNLNDIFLRMQDGLAHYNGTDIQYVYNSPSTLFNIRASAILFDNDVFFCIWDQSNRFPNKVLHGILKDKR